MIIVAQLTFQKILAMVVAQLVELSLPTAEFDGSNPVVIVGNLYWKDKNRYQKERLERPN